MVHIELEIGKRVRMASAWPDYMIPYPFIIVDNSCLCPMTNSRLATRNGCGASKKEEL